FANALQRHAGVQELLDAAQLDEVLERIHPLGPRPPRVSDAGSDQFRAGPVVQLPVGDPHHRAHFRDPKALRFRHHNSVITSKVLGRLSPNRSLSTKRCPQGSKSSGVTSSRNARNFSTSCSSSSGTSMEASERTSSEA